MSASRAAQEGAAPSTIASSTWFWPYTDHMLYGGHYTVLRFIDGLVRRGIAARIVVFDNKLADLSRMKAEMVAQFPALAECELVAIDGSLPSISDLPPSDIAVCTTWQSAYVLLNFNQTEQKFYFIQDYEPLFSPAGSVSALAESTYRFGFSGIVNTPGLLEALRHRHGLDGVAFVPAVDGRYFYPPPARSGAGPTRVFFFARGSTRPRNAFELGILTIERLLERYRGEIEIVVAGSDWNEAQYNLQGKVTNLGLLRSLEEVGELYRKCDIGFVYMLTKHPSYQPFEFMACGMATVSNFNEDNLWFLQDEVNCLLAEPSPTAMAETIGRLIDDLALRTRLASAGALSVSNDWEGQIEDVWGWIARRQQ